MWAHFSVLLVLFASVATSPASAQEPAYTIVVVQSANQTTRQLVATQTARDTRTDKVIWVRHFPGTGEICWSEDHKAAAFEVGLLNSERPQHEDFLKLVTWIAGEQPQSFFTKPEIKDYYTENMLWSFDKKYLLIRTGSGGDNYFGLGALWCLSTATHRVIAVASPVETMKWSGAHQIEYKMIHAFQPPKADYVHVTKDPTRRHWQVPEGF